MSDHAAASSLAAAPSSPSRCRLAARLDARSSSRPRRRPTFSRATSRTSRSTATASSTLGPGDRARLRDRGAVSLVAAAAARRLAVRRHRQRRQGLPHRRPGTRARCSSTARSSKCTRWRPRRTAGCTSARRPTARSTRSIADGAATTFFDPDDKYIWALAVDAKGNVFAGTGDKGVIYKIAPDGKGAPFYKTNATHVDGARLRQGRQPARRHRIARPGAADRSRGQGVRAARFAVSGDPRRCASTTRACCTSRALSGRAGPAARRRSRRSRPRSSRPPIRPRRRSPSVSTEITSISIVDVGGGSDDRRAARGSPRRRRAPSTASLPTASGISSGNRATIRRTT